MLNQIDLRRADLNLLVLFATVLETRHVGRAAQRLHLSPSAVSHGLARLRRLFHDPLFLRTPRGVVPNARAMALAAPVADVLARAGAIIAGATPFEPAAAKRRFTIGGPDAVAAVILPLLLDRLHREAPGIDLTLRLLQPAGPSAGAAPRDSAVAELDAHTIDIAIVPDAAVPARFAVRPLYQEDFVVAARRGHPFHRAPTLAAYCRLPHVLVSLGGDPHGFVDDRLRERGLSRRVALVVPSFTLALAIVARSDLVAAVPRHLVAVQTGALPIAASEAPLRLPGDAIRAVAPRVAMMDAGVAWLMDTLVALGSTINRSGREPGSRRSRQRTLREPAPTGERAAQNRR